MAANPEFIENIKAQSLEELNAKKAKLEGRKAGKPAKRQAKIQEKVDALEQEIASR